MEKELKNNLKTSLADKMFEDLDYYKTDTEQSTTYKKIINCISGIDYLFYVRFGINKRYTDYNTYKVWQSYDDSNIENILGITPELHQAISQKLKELGE